MSLLIVLAGMAFMYGVVVLTGPLIDRVASWVTRHDSDWRMYAGLFVVLFIGGYLS